jgi:threonine synthase
MSGSVRRADTESPNPFIRYRWLLRCYRRAIGQGWTDAEFISRVEQLDEAVRTVDGRGFAITPLTREPNLAAALGVSADRLWVKDDTGNVGESHKGRHLFGVLLDLAVDDTDDRELAIASCGNAAVAAAIVARAAGRKLRVFIPTWADPAVTERLRELDARMEVAPRRESEVGDPTVHRMLEAVAGGAIPFSAQGTFTPSTLDGGRTIGWELAEQLALARVSGRVHVICQVGGGALATCVWQGLNDGLAEHWLTAEPVLHTVQTEAVAPLNRAWRRLLGWAAEHLDETEEWSDERIDAVMEEARRVPGQFMWPWETVGSSAATGILDDVTYDWLPLVDAMLRSRGQAHVLAEEVVLRGNHLARRHTTIPVDATGSAGVGALLDPGFRSEVGPEDNVVVFFTGGDRTVRQA